MDHLRIAAESSPRKDLRQRLTGRFYTPTEVCTEMVEEVIRYGFQPRIVGDPFCGDGRFIRTWLERAHRKNPRILAALEQIVLWDCEADAVHAAQQMVTATLAQLGVTGCKVLAKTCDTFGTFHHEIDKLDLILTNPPWELLKPDSRDLVSRESSVSYKMSLKRYSQQISDTLPSAASHKNKVMGGASVNLARAGALVCCQLLSAHSCMGIVLPASIFADQASAPFRRELFRSCKIQKMQYFPAESRAFVGVDQPFVTVICEGQKETGQFLLQSSGSSRSERSISCDLSGSQSVPLVVSGSQAEILADFEKCHQPLRMLECDMRFGLWLGRELDETRIAESFGRNGVPFLKGRQVDRYSIRPHIPPLVNPDCREIPASIHEDRLAWRDVSRPNQKRRVQATSIPREWVTGNSLGVGYFRYKGKKHLLALLGILNSFVFELQVRAKLHTPHVSLGALRDCFIPWQVFENEQLLDKVAEIVSDLLTMPSPELEACLEREIAKAYNLSREQFGEILKGFPKLSNVEYTQLVVGEI